MRATTLVDVSSAAARPRPTRKHVGLLIWALLFFNGLAFNDIPLLIPIPVGVGKLATQGALALAIVLVLAFNRGRFTRPNLFLGLFTLLALSSLMMSVRLVNGPGTLFRAGRFGAFIGVLWLLSPLFGRADRVLLKWHVTCLVTVLSTVVVGYLIAPGRATQQDGRLAGQLWPIPPTQVGHYAAVLAGVVIMLGLCGVMRGRTATLLGIGAVAVLLLCHTRTALIAMIVAVVCAMLSLLTVRRRVRQAGAVVLLRRHSRGDGLRAGGEDVVHAWAAARAGGPVERAQGRVGRARAGPRARDWRRPSASA